MHTSHWPVLQAPLMFKNSTTTEEINTPQNAALFDSQCTCSVYYTILFFSTLKSTHFEMKKKYKKLKLGGGGTGTKAKKQYYIVPFTIRDHGKRIILIFFLWTIALCKTSQRVLSWSELERKRREELAFTFRRFIFWIVPDLDYQTSRFVIDPTNQCWPRESNM